MTTSSDTLDELQREIEWLKSTLADYEQILDQGRAEDKRQRTALRRIEAGCDTLSAAEMASIARQAL